jgi:prolyl oligopeptidase
MRRQLSISSMMKRHLLLVPISTACVLAWLNLSGAEPLPQTPKKPVTDEFHGVKVEDDYQWLEQDDDPAVKAWSDAQSQQTRQYLDKLPDRAAIEKQLTDWYAKTSPSYSGIVSRPGVLFAFKFQPPKQQQMLVTLASADALKSEKMVLDPSGKTAIDWFVPSRDGKYVAMSISHGGSEDGTLHIYETTTGKPLKDSIAHVQYPTAGGSAAWNADGTGLLHSVSSQRGTTRCEPEFLSADLFS